MVSNGNIFNGTFNNSEKNGCGIYKDTEGTIANGEWRHNMRQGLFKITYSNGSKVCVNFVDGVISGAPRGGDCGNCPASDKKKCICL